MPGFKKATKKRRKLRLAISGISGSGKTYTALELATRLAEEDGGRVALVDTEHGSAADYSALFDFDTAPMPPPYRPDRLVKAAQVAAEEGYPVFVVDGLSPFWNGPGGVLEIVDKANTNKFSGWKEGTPAQNAMVNALLAYPGHVIVTMRSAAEYVVSSSGAPKKVGMAPVQRAGIEYEFALMLSLDDEHVATVTKSRVVESDDRFASLVLGAEITHPDGALAEQMLAWLADGTSEEDEAAAEAQRAEQRARAAAAAENAGAAESGSSAPSEAGAPAQPPAAPAPAARAEGPGVPAAYAKQPGETTAQRDVRIAFRVLVLGQLQGAVAADEHVSTAVVRAAKKKHEAEPPWSGPPPSAGSPAASSTPQPAPTPTTPETPPPAPAASTGASAPAEPSAPATASPVAADAESWGLAPTKPAGAFDDEERSAALALQVAALEPLAQPEGGWMHAIENQCQKKFGTSLRSLTVDQATQLLEELHSIELQLRERANQKEPANA